MPILTLSTLGITGKSFPSLNPESRNKTDPFKLDHWQLSEMQSMNEYHMDHRFTETSQEKCGSLKELEEYHHKMYCDKVGVEFKHVECAEERQWLYENYEKAMLEPLPKSEKLNVLSHLIRAEEFELFLHKKWGSYKRYSGEGSESLVVALNTMFAEASIE